MLKKERQAFILHHVNLQNKVLSSDLSLAMNVSEVTTRSCLQELYGFGKLMKIHGGALSKSSHGSFNTSSAYAADDKKIIAQKAAALICDEMVVSNSGSTTITELAVALSQKLHATFFTGNLPAAKEYVRYLNIWGVCMSGKLCSRFQKKKENS